MWTVIAEEDIRCEECDHVITVGAACLSLAPPSLPKSCRRSEYRNYCVERSGCDVDASPCYVRWVDHHRDLAEAPEGAACAHCGDAIPGGLPAAVQRLYDWPAPDPRHGRSSAPGSVAAAAVKPRPAGWHSLSPALQRKFRRGGLGRGLKPRSQAMAQRLYEKEVPRAIQRMGEPAVRDFMEGKHFSHVKSVANSPGGARAPSNVVLEDARKNLARGSQNMTGAERAAAGSAARGSAIRSGGKALARGGARAGLVAAAAEAAVSIPENVLHYRRGRKSRKQAAKDAATSTAVAGGIGAVVAAGAQTAAMTGVGLAIAPFATPLLICGGVLAVGSAAHRIATAAKSGLDEYRIYFCDHERCLSGFARDVAASAHGT